MFDTGVEQGDHVTSDQFKAGVAEVRAEIAGLDTRLSTQIGDVRTEIANLETRLIRWMVGTVIASSGGSFGVSVRFSVEGGRSSQVSPGFRPLIARRVVSCNKHLWAEQVQALADDAVAQARADRA